MAKHCFYFQKVEWRVCPTESSLNFHNGTFGEVLAHGSKNVLEDKKEKIERS